MAYVPLADAKAYLAVIGDDDDAVIAQCLDAAEFHCAALMGRRSISDIQAVPWIVSDDSLSSDSGDGSAVVPPSVVMAVLMYCADFYENRGVSMTAALSRNPAADSLLHMHRIGLGA